MTEFKILEVVKAITREFEAEGLPAPTVINLGYKQTDEHGVTWHQISVDGFHTWTTGRVIDGVIENREEI